MDLSQPIMDRKTLESRLVAAQQQHRDLDIAIQTMLEDGSGDMLQIQRMKKRKLALRDEICWIEDLLTPDIIA